MEGGPPARVLTSGAIEVASFGRSSFNFPPGGCRGLTPLRRSVHAVGLPRQSAARRALRTPAWHLLPLLSG
jgi:hypothetical protein